MVSAGERRSTVGNMQIGGVRESELTTKSARNCRCGTTIRPGERVILVHMHEEGRYFDTFLFCSFGCVADLRERFPQVNAELDDE